MTSEKNVSEEWKEYHRQLAVVIPFYKKVYIRFVKFLKALVEKDSEPSSE